MQRDRNKIQSIIDGLESSIKQNKTDLAELKAKQGRQLSVMKDLKTALAECVRQCEQYEEQINSVVSWNRAEEGELKEWKSTIELLPGIRPSERERPRTETKLIKWWLPCT